MDRIKTEEQNENSRSQEQSRVGMTFGDAESMMTHSYNTLEQRGVFSQGINNKASKMEKFKFRSLKPSKGKDTFYIFMGNL